MRVAVVQMSFDRRRRRQPGGGGEVGRAGGRPGRRADRAARELRLPAPRRDGASPARSRSTARSSRALRAWARAPPRSGSSAAPSTKRSPATTACSQHAASRSRRAARSSPSTARSTSSTSISRRTAARSTASRRPSRRGPKLASFETPAGVVGLSVCYDVRFPGAVPIARRARRAIPLRARCVRTRDRSRPLGSAAARARDREPVLRAGARAVRPNTPAAGSAYGRSMVVDPWGLVLARAPDRPGPIFAECHARGPGSRARVAPGAAPPAPLAGSAARLKRPPCPADAGSGARGAVDRGSQRWPARATGSAQRS